MSLIPCAKNRRQRGLADFWKKFSFRKADKLSITDESCWLDNYCICFLSVIKWIQTSPFTLHTSLSKRRQYLNSANDPGLLSLQLPELLLHRLSTLLNIGSAVQCSAVQPHFTFQHLAIRFLIPFLIGPTNTISYRSNAISNRFNRYNFLSV